jgi:hypothetical protein
MLCCTQANKYADLPYFLSLAAMTIYIGAHRGLNSRQRQQISIKEGLLAPVAASGARLAGRLAGWRGDDGAAAASRIVCTGTTCSSIVKLCCAVACESSDYSLVTLSDPPI